LCNATENKTELAANTVERTKTELTNTLTENCLNPDDYLFKATVKCKRLTDLLCFYLW